jgi:multiple antibiotic resistance protein
MELFIYLFAALFSVLNPIGTVPIFVGLTMDDDAKERSRISLWTAINVFIILIISFFLGNMSLHSLELVSKLPALRRNRYCYVRFSPLTGNLIKNEGK